MDVKKIDDDIITVQEDIKKYEKHIEQLEHQRDRIINRNKSQERKARTRRLIERGAMLESHFPAEYFKDNHEVQELLEIAFNSEEVKQFLKTKKESR